MLHFPEYFQIHDILQASKGVSMEYELRLDWSLCPIIYTAKTQNVNMFLKGYPLEAKNASKK